jgi:hypothetical protein
MRFPPGVDEKRAIFGYMTALNGFTIEAIEYGIRKFLRGECEGVNPKYCPHPPELAAIIRTAVVPNRVLRLPTPVHPDAPTQGERERMRLKMPMYRHAYACGLMDELDAANKAGFGAMVVLATRWGIEVPEELLSVPEAQAERQWREARNRAWGAIERNPPPFMRRIRVA